MLLAADPEDAAIMELSEQLAESEMTLEELEASEEQQVERLEQLRQQLQQATQAQQQAQGDLQRLNGRLASLEALQQAALDPGTGTAETGACRKALGSSLLLRTLINPLVIFCCGLALLCITPFLSDIAGLFS